MGETQTQTTTMAMTKTLPTRETRMTITASTKILEYQLYTRTKTLQTKEIKKSIVTKEIKKSIYTKQQTRRAIPN
jgi:hypothetical protein